MTDLNELLERVKKATGRDRQLDYALFCHFAPREVASAWHPLNGHKYTSSIDAALGLVERLLSGWAGQLYWAKSGFICCLEKEGPSPQPAHWSEQLPIAPLAILAVLLSALISKESQS